MLVSAWGRAEGGGEEYDAVSFVEEFVGLAEGVGFCGRGVVRFEKGIEVGC
jgi:hypothetical protein